MDEFRQFMLEYNMKFVRSIMLSAAFMYIFFGILRSYTDGSTGVEIWSLRISVVIFILTMYALTYTEMFEHYYEYFLILTVSVNSAILMTMGIVVLGLRSVSESTFTMLPFALTMLIVTYMFPLRFRLAVMGGILVSLPFMIVTLFGNSITNTVATSTILIILNVLLAFNTHSKETVMKDLHKFIQREKTKTEQNNYTKY